MTPSAVAGAVIGTPHDNRGAGKPTFGFERSTARSSARYGKEEPMFGKKARDLKRAARAASEAKRTVRTAKAAKVRERQLAKEASDKIADRMSPAEKTRAQRNSVAERMKCTPSV
jgi:hypothetical protein